jgi:hypothetical protein
LLEDEKEDYEVRENVMDYDEEGAGQLINKLVFGEKKVVFPFLTTDYLIDHYFQSSYETCLLSNRPAFTSNLCKN